MCYDVKANTREEKYYQQQFDWAFKNTHESLSSTPLFHASGFSHPELMVIASEENQVGVSMMRWGLIPFWCKDMATASKISNQTLNARGESIFEKPAFRAAAKSRRCLVILDGFYEHHHYKKETIPFHIQMKDAHSFCVAGLYENWRFEEKEIQTVSIVTTKGNALLEKIHNNPKMEFGPRMPLIIPKGLESKWIGDRSDPLTKEEVTELMQPYDSALMEGWPVGKLRGKNAVGNKAEVTARVATVLDWV